MIRRLFLKSILLLVVFITLYYYANNNNYILPGVYNVSNTTLCTTISNEFGNKVSTIEHLMGALYGKGVDNTQGFVDALVYEEVLLKAGAWYKYDGTNIAKGMKALRAALEDNPDLKDELQSKLDALRK